ncbi:MAG: PhnD/SsuA/transferrin family substrate-binding protein [Alphaproteobacteria bacterium]|nr:PhnD/SsuA/transferrin family substrate-binding protein [Alphaproteobacteria bacterium]
MTIKLYEHQRAIFYAPFYAAHVLGAYQDAGVEVEIVTSPNPAVTANGLRDGTADVAWGGPMRVLLAFDSNPECDLVLFAEAVTRDPFFLIGRVPNPNFEQANLLGVKLARVSEVPTPWLCLQEDLRRAGLDPADVTRLADGSMAENVAEFQSGKVDVVQVYQPYAEELLRDGAHIWYAAATRGPTSYTSLFTTRRRFEAAPESMAALTCGLYQTLQWLIAAPPETVAETISSYFPDVSHDLLTACIARYQTLQIWNQTPVLSPAGFERLKTSCLSGGLITRDTPYEACVDNRYAETAVTADSKTM